jgi:hypothetical protein
MCSSALFQFRVSGSKKLIQQVYRADKSSPCGLPKTNTLSLYHPCTPGVPSNRPLQPHGGMVLISFIDCGLPDLRPPNHVA